MMFEWFSLNTKFLNMGRRLTQEQVIERIVQIHWNTYDLSRVNYKNKRTKIELVCKINFLLILLKWHNSLE